MEEVAYAFCFKELPKDKEYMLHYFGRSLKKDFLIYYFLVRDYIKSPEKLRENFIDHSGRVVGIRWIFFLINRIKALEKLIETEDLMTVMEVKSGNYKGKLPSSNYK